MGYIPYVLCDFNSLTFIKLLKMTENPTPNEKPSANNVPCWDAEGDLRTVTERLREMFVEMGQKTRIERGQQPAERSVFRKQHGIAYGHFVIDKDIPPEFKIGIFAGDTYECTVRFSSDTAPDGPDLHSTLGVGLK